MATDGYRHHNALNLADNFSNESKKEKDREKEKSECIKVLVRVRPISNNEYAGEFGGESVVDISNQTALSVASADGKRTFQCAFDAVLGPHSTQTDVYETVRECTHSVIEGFNSTIFAYGQTGSGETFPT